MIITSCKPKCIGKSEWLGGTVLCVARASIVSVTHKEGFANVVTREIYS